MAKINPDELVLNEKLIALNRVSKVVKGGKRMRFNALVVVGDGAGHVGIGLAKSNEVPSAIAKAGAYARKNIVKVPLKGNTIPSEATVKLGASVVFLKPASAVPVLSPAVQSERWLKRGVKGCSEQIVGVQRLKCCQEPFYALSQLKDPRQKLPAQRIRLETKDA